MDIPKTIKANENNDLKYRGNSMEPIVTGIDLAKGNDMTGYGPKKKKPENVTEPTGELEYFTE